MSAQLLKLSEKTQSYELSAGGQVELTPSDVSAALGMVDSELRRQLLCLRWWPQGYRAKVAEPIIRKYLVEQWDGQQVGLQALRLKQHIAACEDGQVKALEAELEIDKYKSKIWPSPSTGRYQKLVKNVLDEWNKTDLCKACNGQKILLKVGGNIVCNTCNGTGVADDHRSARSRARNLGVSQTTFINGWAGIYNHTLRYLQDEYLIAKDIVKNTLGS